MLTKTRWAWTLATFFGTGFLKPGPGTYASAFTVLLWFGTIHATHPTPVTQAIATLIVAFAITAIGIPASTIVARESATEDPSHVVIDEVAGQLFALIALPASWPHAALALLLFRFFDILKPPPIRQLERIPNGAGIMLDDAAAGLFALLFAYIIPYALVALHIATFH